MANEVAPEPCPTCGGDMYDNSLTKRNPRSPDYVCMDAKCLTNKGQRTAVWISDTMRNARESERATSGPRPRQAPPTGPHRAAILDALYYRCMLAARDNVAANVKLLASYTNADVIAIATALFHERLKGGLLKAEENLLRESAKPKPRPAPPPPPPPKQAPSHDFDDFPSALEEVDDDLPF